MTFVGKVLVVLNVVLTIFIATFAAGVFAVQKNWKDQYESKEQELSKVREDNQKLIEGKDAKITELDRELKETEDLARQHKAKVDELREQVASIQKNYEKMQGEYDVNKNLLKVLDDDKTTKANELKTLRSAMKQLHAKLDQLDAQITQLEDEKYGLVRKQRQIQKKHNEILELLVAYRKTLQLHDIDFDPRAVAGRDVLPDPADGLVTEVLPGNRDRLTLVEISIGTDDGVREGTQLYVYRLSDKGKYLGQIKVIRVSADKAVGELVDDAKQGPIKKGDNVSAKL